MGGSLGPGSQSQCPHLFGNASPAKVRIVCGSCMDSSTRLSCRCSDAIVDMPYTPVTIYPLVVTVAFPNAIATLFWLLIKAYDEEHGVLGLVPHRVPITAPEGLDICIGPSGVRCKRLCMFLSSSSARHVHFSFRSISLRKIAFPHNGDTNTLVIVPDTHMGCMFVMLALYSRRHSPRMRMVTHALALSDHFSVFQPQ